MNHGLDPIRSWHQVYVEIVPIVRRGTPQWRRSPTYSEATERRPTNIESSSMMVIIMMMVVVVMVIMVVVVIIVVIIMMMMSFLSTYMR